MIQTGLPATTVIKSFLTENISIYTTKNIWTLMGNYLVDTVKKLLLHFEKSNVNRDYVEPLKGCFAYSIDH